MRAEALAHRWVALLLGAVLLSTGCVTLAPRHGGSTSEGPRALSTLRETGASTPSLEAPSPLASTETSEHAFSAEPERLHRRRSARGLGPDAALASMVKLLREDATKPRAERRFLGDFDRPRIEIHVGVRKTGSGLRYADVLVIEEGALGGRPRRVETFSFKSRDFSQLGDRALEAQMKADASEALRHYGETLDIRRNSLQSILPGGSEVQAVRVRLVYEGGDLKPTKLDNLEAVVTAAEEAVPGVEVLFQ